MKRIVLVLLPLFCMLFISCSKDDETENEADFYYLQCDDNMPTYVISAFREQIATDRTSDDITVNPQGGDIWEFKWISSKSEVAGFGRKVTTTTHKCSCKVKILKNGNVDFVDRSISITSSSKYTAA